MLRYYPLSKVIPNKSTSGGEFTLNGKQYKGKYYITYDGKYFSGPNPQSGPSELLQKNSNNVSDISLSAINIAQYSNEQDQKILANKVNKLLGKPTSYFPNPTVSDYKRGYIIRYFVKKENENGYIIEISNDEYTAINNGTANYDTRLYQTVKILWKITGPLLSKRTSQYNVIAGIVDTNKRLVETANKNFFGLIEYIAEEYSKFARLT